LKIDHSNPVWATDITDIPMRRGFVYLVAIVDGYSRRVLAWRLSNTLSTDSASMRWKRPSPVTAHRKSSTPIRAAHSPALNSPGAQGKRHPDQQGWQQSAKT